MRLCRCAAIALLAVTSIPADSFAEVLSVKECSTRFQAMKDAGTASTKWSEFRKSVCGIEHTVAAAQAIASQPAPVPIVPQGVKFPAKIDEKFAAEPAARQRMRTCLEAYHANKAGNTLGGLRWVQKGGGYYSLCSARLKSSNK